MKRYDVYYPHRIENCLGEVLIFKGVEKEQDGDRLLVENFVTPGNGPVMHTHLLQDECLTVLEGRLGYEIQGQPAKFVGEGQTVLFKKEPHTDSGMMGIQCCTARDG